MPFGKAIKRHIKSKDRIITRRVDEWLRTHPGGIVLSDRVADIIRQLMVENENSDRTGRFGASSVFTCQRRQVFEFLGMPFKNAYDSRLVNLFNDGTWRHLRWQAMGLTIPIFTEVEAKGVLPQWYRKLSADAVNTEEGWGFELKGTSWMSYVINNGVPPKHEGQCHLGMMAFGFDRWVYVAEDKQTQDFEEIVVHRDEAVVDTIKKEMNELADAIEDRTLPPIIKACYDHKGEEWKNCEFREACLNQGEVWPDRPVWVELRGPTVSNSKRVSRRRRNP